MTANGITIYLIDDSEATNEINRYFFEEFGYPELNIKMFRNGLEALKDLELNNIWPKIIVLDLRMSVLDGFGFLEQIHKAEKFHSDCPNIFISSSTENKSDLSRLDKYPFIQGFIDKPMTEQKVKMILSKLL